MVNDFYVISGDIDKAIEVMRDVALWCEKTGKKMWKLGDLTKEKLAEGLTPQNFFIGRVHGEAASSMILQWYDPLFWPEVLENESGFIHKLCVSRKYAGLGVSNKMVEYAIEECRRRKVKYLRLDTGWKRAKLCIFYESLGFVKVGKRTVNEKDYALYEMLID